MKESKSFGYLGHTFQIKLINQLITDKKFANSILEVIDPKYFDNQYFKLISQMVKEYFEQYNTIPTFDVLDQITRLEVSSEMAKQTVFDMLKE